MGTMIHREELSLRTKGETQVLDLTENVRALVRKSGVKEGTVHLFVPGSCDSTSRMPTGNVTT